MDSSAVAHGIQLAVAPVFMLSAVAALITALATRLSRIIDRARNIEERLAAGTVPHEDAAYWELNRLRLRGRVVNWSVGLLVVCAMLIGATMARNLGVTPGDVQVDLACAEGAGLVPGSDVEARVTVAMPAVQLPGIGAMGAWSWTARHREPVDRYVSAR